MMQPETGNMAPHLQYENRDRQREPDPEPAGHVD